MSPPLFEALLICASFLLTFLPQLLGLQILSTLLAVVWMLASFPLFFSLPGVSSVFIPLLWLMIGTSGYLCGRLSVQKIVRGVSTRSTLDYPRALGFELRDARLLGTLTGEYTKHWTWGSDDRSESSSYFAAPVVDAGWTPDQAVMLWAGAIESDQTTLREGPCQGGLNAGKLKQSRNYMEAAKESAKAHNLTIHPESVLLFPEPTEGLRTRYGQLAFWLFVVPAGLWLIRIGFLAWSAS